MCLDCYWVTRGVVLGKVVIRIPGNREKASHCIGDIAEYHAPRRRSIFKYPRLGMAACTHNIDDIDDIAVFLQYFTDDHR